ncbi:hypothetical protein ACSBR1_039413 [Camellia fascicularis]
MRGGKSCRLRWKNSLRPNMKHGSMSDEEKDLIIRLHKLLGNRNEIKNYWNTQLDKTSSSQHKDTDYKDKKKLRQLPISQPIRSESSKNNKGSSGKQEDEEVTVVTSPWTEDLGWKMQKPSSTLAWDLHCCLPIMQLSSMIMMRHSYPSWIPLLCLKHLEAMERTPTNRNFVRNQSLVRLCDICLNFSLLNGD